MRNDASNDAINATVDEMKPRRANALIHNVTD